MELRHSCETLYMSEYKSSKAIQRPLKFYGGLVQFEHLQPFMRITLFLRWGQLRSLSCFRCRLSSSLCSRGEATTQLRECDVPV